MTEKPIIVAATAERVTAIWLYRSFFTRTASALSMLTERKKSPVTLAKKITPPMSTLRLIGDRYVRLTKAVWAAKQTLRGKTHIFRSEEHPTTQTMEKATASTIIAKSAGPTPMIRVEPVSSEVVVSLATDARVLHKASIVMSMGGVLQQLERRHDE